MANKPLEGEVLPKINYEIENGLYYFKDWGLYIKADSLSDAVEKAKEGHGIDLHQTSPFIGDDNNETERLTSARKEYLDNKPNLVVEGGKVVDKSGKAVQKSKEDPQG